MKPLLASTFLLFAAVIASGRDAHLSMVYTNALGEDHPFALFRGKPWKPAAQTRYVKLHLHFDEPIPVRGMEIDDCGSRLDPAISVFFNFDQWILRTDSALQGSIPEALYPKRKGNVLVLQGFEETIEVRSLTVNFEANSDFQLCGLRLVDPAGTAYSIRTPELIPGTVEATSVLEPAAAYDPIHLFDSRFEHGWATQGKDKGASLIFHFSAPKKVAKLRLWNGYQRSLVHCQANSRARKARLTGDGGYAAEIMIRDRLGSQVIDLPKPFEGRRLEMEILDAYRGKDYRDLVLSELRFHDGTGWFMPDPTPFLRAAIAGNRRRFAAAEADSLLGGSYLGEQKFDREPWFVSATLRLRADGSFYLSGGMGETGDSAYFALGNYELKAADAKQGLKLRLFGLHHVSEEYGDCNGCGWDCNGGADPEGPAGKVFQEVINLTRAKGGGFIMTNASGGRKLRFSRMILRRQEPTP